MFVVFVVFVTFPSTALPEICTILHDALYVAIVQLLATKFVALICNIFVSVFVVIFLFCIVLLYKCRFVSVEAVCCITFAIILAVFSAQLHYCYFVLCLFGSQALLISLYWELLHTGQDRSQSV